MTQEYGEMYFLRKYGHVIKITWGKKVARQLGSTPRNVVAKFFEWIELVQLTGLLEVRKRPGFHDEPLQGKRKEQRSIRLNRSYRAIYVEISPNQVEIVEITKHDY